MTEQTYRGSCQCQAVQFEASLDLDNTMVCNCSRCQRLGWVMAFAPRAKITFSQGEGATTQYLFNKERIRHQFCPTCGIETLRLRGGQGRGRDGRGQRQLPGRRRSARAELQAGRRPLALSVASRHGR